MLSRKRRWLARAQTIDDLRTMAARTTPRSVFDYVDGGAESEISVERSRESFQKLTFHPRILRGVSEVDTRALILGKQARLPLVLGPSGFTRMLHHEGERGVAVAAATAGIPYALSTMGTTSLEDVRSAAPHGEHWFQLYVWRDRGLSAELIRRAQAAGYSALVLTVDVPVPGARLRDIRNGLTIPPALRLRTLADMSRHLSWWFNLLTTEPLSFASLSQSPTALNELITTMFDPSVTFDDLEWLRSQWQGPLIVKGIQRADDAVRAVQAGADAPGAVQPRRAATRPCGHSARVVASGSRRGPGSRRDLSRRWRPQRRRCRSGDCTWCPGMSDRPPLPLRPDGRGSGGCPSNGGHPQQRAHQNDAVARRTGAHRVDA